MKTAILDRIATADNNRVLRAIQALEDGSLTCQLTSAADDKITAVVKSKTSHYTVLLAPHYTECSCPDFRYRDNVICKHQIALALYCEKIQQEEKTPDLRLGKVRQEWQAAA